MDPKNAISYLCARDPSIISWGRTALDKVKCNLEPLMESQVVEEPEVDDKVLVYLRVKKQDDLDLYDIEGNTLLCKVPEGSLSVKNARDGDTVIRKYTFSGIFPPDATQKEIFDTIVKPRLVNFINGRSNTLLTYGASGSGKTFTIVGTDTHPGILPRALEYVFRTLPQFSELPLIKPKDNGGFVWLTDGMQRSERDNLQNLLNNPLLHADRVQHLNTYRAMQQRLSGEPVAMLESVDNISLSMWVSFAEIYNEHVYDLLDPESNGLEGRKKLKICNNNGVSYIRDLSSVYVSSGIEAFQILQGGLRNLQYAATSINKHSSRSHCIFSLKLLQASSKTDVKTTQFNFCDLAGSERSKKTHNIGDRLKESNNINTSLLVLGKCINLIRQAQRCNEKKRIPFRESKLTQLFQKALTGHESIAMIVNINPERCMFDESMHTLGFSAIARKIIIEQPKVPQKKDRLSKYFQGRSTAYVDNRNELDERGAEVQRLRNTIQELYDQIESLREENLRIEHTTRMEVANSFEKLVMDENAKWQLKYDAAIDEIEELKDQLQNKMSRLESSADSSSIIVLDSSTEDATEKTIKRSKSEAEAGRDEDQPQFKRPRLETSATSSPVVLLDISTEDAREKSFKRHKSEADAEALRSENEMLKKQLELTNLECEKLRGTLKERVRDNLELRQTLEEAVTELQELSKENNELAARNIELEEELELYRHQHAVDTELESNGTDCT